MLDANEHRTTIKTNLFATEHHLRKIDKLGDPLVALEAHMDFSALAAEVDRIAPRPVSDQGGRPPYPTETMVRIRVLKRLNKLPSEQMEYQSLDRMMGITLSRSLMNSTRALMFMQIVAIPPKHGKTGSKRRVTGTGFRGKGSATSRYLRVRRGETSGLPSVVRV